MTRVDITADLNSEDETGFVWTFLDEADDPSIIRPGEVVVAGSPLTPAVCEVVDLVEKPAGTVVHLGKIAARTVGADSTEAHGGRFRYQRVIVPEPSRLLPPDRDSLCRSQSLIPLVAPGGARFRGGA